MHRLLWGPCGAETAEQGRVIHLGPGCLHRLLLLHCSVSRQLVVLLDIELNLLLMWLNYDALNWPALYSLVHHLDRMHLLDMLHGRVHLLYHLLWPGNDLRLGHGSSNVLIIAHHLNLLRWIQPDVHWLLLVLILIHENWLRLKVGWQRQNLWKWEPRA